MALFALVAILAGCNEGARSGDDTSPTATPPPTSARDPEPLHISIDAGEELYGLDAGVFFVDIATGATEGWIAPDSAQNPTEFHVRNISADGKHVLYTCADTGDGGLLPCGATAGAPFPNYVLDTTDGARVRLTRLTGEFVTMPPDAAIVLGETRDGLAWAHRSEPEVALPVPLATEDGTRLEAAWSPTSDVVLVEQYHASGTTKVSLVRFDGTPPKDLDVPAGLARWSPDGTKVAIADRSLPLTTVFDEHGVLLWANSEPGFGPNPRWSPDSRLLALPVKPRDASAAHAARIDVLDADLGTLVYRVTGAIACEGFIWNSDGSQMIFVGYGNASSVRLVLARREFINIPWLTVVPSPYEPDVVIMGDGHRFVYVPPSFNGRLIVNTYALPAWFPHHEPLFAGGRIVFVSPHQRHTLCEMQERSENVDPPPKAAIEVINER